MKTVTELRNSFWDAHPDFKNQFRKSWKHNQYSATIRSTFADYKSMLLKDGTITISLYNRATL